MTPFTRRGDEVTAVFERGESEILLQLASHLQELLGDIDGLDPRSPGSRAASRLMPSAYGDDGENDAEFRRFTQEGLIDRKVTNATRLVTSLAQNDPAGEGNGVVVSLDAVGVQSWLRSLTDMRLVLAARLGIEADGDEQRVRRADRYAVELYGWLGFVQESLVGAMESAPEPSGTDFSTE